MYYNSGRERTREKSRSPRRSKDRKKDRRGRSSSSSRVRHQLNQDQGRGRQNFQKNRHRVSLAENKSALIGIRQPLRFIRLLDQQIIIFKNFREFEFQKDDYLNDIKFFKKDDQPNAKNLNDADIYQYKLTLERDNYNNIYLDSEQIKHRESLMEGDAMKKVRQIEKTFNQKLLSSKEDISYYAPPFLKICIQQNGINSIEKQGHTNRISSTLGCYYSKVSQIPDEPTMTNIINDLASSTPPKIIAFQRSTQQDKLEAMKFTKPQPYKQVKQIKGILKRSLEQLKKMRLQALKQQQSANTTIDPQFFRIFRDISSNKDKYTNQQIQLLFRPFRQNGTLQINLKKMKQMETPKPPTPTFSSVPPPNYSHMMNGTNPNMNMGLTPQMTPQQIQMMQYNQMQAQNMMRTIKMQKFKTVPCKYFHGPQGCEKKTGCTFIHDEAYAGRQIPQQQSRFRPQYPSAGPPNQFLPPQQPNYQQNYGMMNQPNYGRMPMAGYQQPPPPSYGSYNNNSYPQGISLPPPPSS